MKPSDQEEMAAGHPTLEHPCSGEPAKTAYVVDSLPRYKVLKTRFTG